MTLWDPLLRMRFKSVVAQNNLRSENALENYWFVYLFISKAINFFTYNVFSEKESVSDKRDGVCMVVLLSVLLFLSLLVNAVLAYLCELAYLMFYTSVLHISCVCNCVCTVYQFLNTILCFTDYTSDTNQLMGCEPVTNNSNLGL